MGGLGSLARSAIAAGLGIAMAIPGSSAVAMFVGAFLAWAWRRLRQASADRDVIPIASGLIAGESLMGVVVALLVAFKVIQR